MLELLRGDPTARPPADPDVVEQARSHLETASSAWTPAVPEGVVVRVTKDAVAGVRRCEARHLAELAAREAPPGGGDEAPSSPGDAPSPALVRGRLLDALFRQVATTGAVGPDPVADAVAAGQAAGEGSCGFDSLDEESRERVTAEVAAASARLVADWPELPAGAGLRTQERVLVGLAGGRVLLSGRPDLTVGRPTRAHGGPCGRGQERHLPLGPPGGAAVLRPDRGAALGRGALPGGGVVPG